jgi:hypothetical protein
VYYRKINDILIGGMVKVQRAIIYNDDLGIRSLRRTTQETYS